MKRGALVAAALSASACSVFTSIPGAEAARVAHRVPGTQLFDWKGVVHCHSHFSHDSDGTLETIAAAAQAHGIDFVVMTDHQTEASVRDGVRGRVGDTLFVVGAEVGCRKSSLLAFPLQKPLRRFQHPALLVAEAHEQGALVFLCHAERWDDGWDTPGLDGVEIVNLHAGAKAAGAAGTVGTALFLPVRALLERFCQRNPEVFRRWDAELLRGRRLSPVGGNDAHANVRAFGPLGGTIGDYREVFAMLSTHVLAERLDEASLVAALRAGRSYVAFDGFGAGRGFDFRGVSGNSVHLMGDVVSAAPELVLRIRTPSPGIVTLWRDGERFVERTGTAVELHDPGPGVYRVEVQTLDGQPWLFSGAIRVLPGEPAPGR